MREHGSRCPSIAAEGRRRNASSQFPDIVLTRCHWAHASDNGHNREVRTGASMSSNCPGFAPVVLVDASAQADRAL